MGRLNDLVGTYVSALREEPKMRAYLCGQLMDDIGTVVSLWGGQLIMAKIFIDQRTRASVMIPILVSSFLGILIGGPLADWIRAYTKKDMERLARWRWKLVVLGRSFETATLSILIYNLAIQRPSVATLLPYFIVSTFVRTGLISTRVAFEVDLLGVEETQTDENGQTLLDENQEPRMFKRHLLPMVAALSVFNATATLAGLLLGGQIMGFVGDQLWIIFVVDITTNAAYIATVFLFCHPNKRRGTFADLGRDPLATKSSVGLARRVLTPFATSVADAARFLKRPDQRPLLWMFIGGVVLDAAAQCFDDKMLMVQIVKVADETLRKSELFWSVVAISAPALLPALQRKVSSLGKLFVFAMIIDGLAIMVAGRLAGAAALAPIIPFVVVLGIDRGFNVTSKTLIALAQNSASSPAMRGRLSSAYLLAITATNIGIQVVATQVSEAVGIPRMIFYVGCVQVTAVCVLAFASRKTLWNFGLKADSTV